MSEIDPSLPHYDVRLFLSKREPGPDADARVAELLGLPSGKPYTTDLNAIVDALHASGGWWSLSHLEARVCPTAPAEGLQGLVTNASRYDREGRPIFYRAMSWRNRSAWALCEAWIKATYDLPDAFAIQASHTANVMARPVRSREEMMAYYEARENIRQQTIESLAPHAHTLPSS